MQRTHSSTTPPSAVTQSRTLSASSSTPFSPMKPMRAAPASLALVPPLPALIEPEQKVQILAEIRACAVVFGNIAEHRKRLAQLARLIPDFSVFRILCLEDIQYAWIEDRKQKTRYARSRRLAWRYLFKPFAQIHGITQTLSIKALDRQGNYACALVDHKAPSRWDTFMSLGLNLGIPQHDLDVLYAKTDEAQQPAALTG